MRIFATALKGITLTFCLTLIVATGAQAYQDPDDDNWSSSFSTPGFRLPSISVRAFARTNSHLYVGGYLRNAIEYGELSSGIINFRHSDGKRSGMGNLGGTVNAIAILSDGDVIAGGDFTYADSDSSIKYIARWNGVSWSSLDGMQGGLDGPVHALLVKDDVVYVGGE